MPPNRPPGSPDTGSPTTGPPDTDSPTTGPPDSGPQGSGTTGSLVVMLSRLARAHEAVLADLNERHGLLPSETGVLLALAVAGPERSLRPSVLAAALEQTTGGMTATLRRLEAAGLLERVPDPADGRVSLARLTEAGAATGTGSFRDMVTWFDDALAGVGEPRRNELLAAVQELFSAVERGRGRAS